MSLKTFESLKLRLTKDRCPFVVTVTGTSMEPIGFTECSFDIDGHVFTQKFIVCNNQTRPIILAKNCIGVMWTKQGSRKMMDDDCKVIMEVKEQTTDVPLSLTNSIRIPPHTIAVAVVECTIPLNSTMDIRADEGFLRDFPNIHVARSYVNNPQQSLAPNCIPFAFTNLSMYSQYLGKDKVVLCERYPKVFSKGNEDIGQMQLVTMDIDTGDSPPISSRPYTLALKHHRWVQEEIETLERAGVITKSMSPWASPIVVVPKKSQPGEPPKERLCIDFRKINDLQQKVITEGKSKGCLSLIPLPKIDEMYTKLKGAKFFTTIDLRSGYYHIALGKDSRAKTAFVMPFVKYDSYKFHLV